MKEKKESNRSVNPNMPPLERFLVHDACFKAGIIPLETSNADVGVSLKQLPPDEARKAKRKFRKLWRREQARFGGCESLGNKGQRPKRWQRVARKRAVMHRVGERIAPVLGGLTAECDDE